jgi:hypothetical protein
MSILPLAGEEKMSITAIDETVAAESIARDTEERGDSNMRYDRYCASSRMPDADAKKATQDQR